MTGRKAGEGAIESSGTRALNGGGDDCDRNRGGKEETIEDRRRGSYVYIHGSMYKNQAIALYGIDYMQ